MTDLISGIRKYSFLVILVVSVASCKDKKEHKQKTALSDTVSAQPTIFEFMSPDSTGVYFANQIFENENLNYLTYEYMYNGGGVAIGDINNDGLPDIFLASNFESNKLYLNKGDFKFEDITESAGLVSTGLSTGVTMVDINSDGLLDIYVCQSFSSDPSKRKNRLYINKDGVTFSDQAEQYGLSDSSFSNHATFFDCDGDGDLDLFLTNHRVDFDAANVANKIDYLEMRKGDVIFQKEKEYTTTKLYKNNGKNKFYDATENASVHGYNYSLSAIIRDFENDGDPDIYVANDFGDVDNYYVNNGNGRFSDDLTRSFGHISRNSMGTDAADINNDGFVDIISLDMIAEDNFRQKKLKGPSLYDKYYLAVDNGLYHQVMRNTLQLNNGDGTFSEIGALAGVSHTDWSWSPLFADFDNDGWKDLFITNGNYRDATDLDYLKYNSAAEVTKAGGYHKVKKMTLLNTMPQQFVPNYMFRNNHDLTFENVSSSWGFDQNLNSQGAAYGDLDMDGDLDLVINNLGSAASVYRNNLEKVQPSNYIVIKLDGPEGNKQGFGSMAILERQDAKLYDQLWSTRGFFSASQPVFHFGISNDTIIPAITIVWPDGRSETKNGIQPNQIITFRYAEASRSNGRKQLTRSTSNGYLVQTDLGIDHTHVESSFNDFKTDPLITHQFSNKGPYIESGDLNNDGLEDVIIGGSAGHPATIYFQNRPGRFSRADQETFRADAACEDMDIAIFDFDNDGDNDIYIVSGSSEFKRGASDLQDRLYLNDGKGIFTKAGSAIPQESENGTCVIPLDYNNDGLTDLFIGASPYRTSFPVASHCILLENIDGRKFEDRSGRYLPGSGDLGIINDAVYTDLDEDGNSELILAGEWKPIMILQFNGESFEDKTAKFGLKNSSGIWNCIEITDIDNDDDLDLVAGNNGLNSVYRANKFGPAKLYYADFDNNSSIDPFQFYYYPDGNLYPRHVLDEVFTQMPSIRKRFGRYSDYARATVNEFFTNEQLQKAKVLEAAVFESSIFINEDGKLVRRSLPVEAQVSPINCIKPLDINQGNPPNLLVIGNNYGVDAETGRYDAMGGMILLNDEGELSATTAWNNLHTGKNDFREIVTIPIQNSTIVIITRNSGSVLTFKIDNSRFTNQSN